MRWFISDLHLFHKRIINRYGRSEFNSIDEMHTKIITEWNKNIKNKDVVYIVGDISFGSYEDTKSFIDKLNGNKILIRGNHDYRFTSKDIINMGFIDVRDFLRIKLSNTVEILLSHYPYAVPWYKLLYYKLFKKHNYRPYYQHYPNDRGLYLIHGHHHGGPKFNDRNINVSCETLNYKPLSESEICKYINRRV